MVIRFEFGMTLFSEIGRVGDSGNEPGVNHPRLQCQVNRATVE